MLGRKILLAAVIGCMLVLAGVASAETGVTGDKILIGQPAPFSGLSAGLGVEVWRGMEAAIREVNDAGGVNGRKIQPVLCDDMYDPKGAEKCTVDLVKKQQVFVLANSVGTPTLVRILSFLRTWKSDLVLLVGNVTGAQPQRTMPFVEYVYNVRASYHQEAAKHVAACVEDGNTKVGTYVQNDAFGKDGEEGVRKALAASGGKTIAASAYYERDKVEYKTDVSQQVKSLRDAGVNCVCASGTFHGVGAFIRTARKAGWDVPVYALSFVGANQLLTFLRQDTSEIPIIMKNIVVTQVVPPVDEVSNELVKQYRAAMDKYNPSVPPAPFNKGGYKPEEKYSFFSLEGYLNTKILIEGIKRAGSDLTRKSFRDAIETMKSVDLGIGAGNAISFGPVTGDADRQNHQALNNVWYTHIADGKWAAGRK